MNSKLEYIIIGKKNVEAFKSGRISVAIFDWNEKTAVKYDTGDTIDIVDTKSVSRLTLSQARILNITALKVPNGEDEEEEREFVENMKNDWNKLGNEGDPDSKFATYVKSLKKFKNTPIRVEFETFQAEELTNSYVPEIGDEVINSFEKWEVFGVYENGTAQIAEIDGPAKKIVPFSELELVEPVKKQPVGKVKESELLARVPAEELQHSIELNNELQKDIIRQAKVIADMQELLNADECVTINIGYGLQHLDENSEEEEPHLLSNHYKAVVERIMIQFANASASLWPKVRDIINEHDTIAGEVILELKTRVDFDSLKTVILDKGNLKATATFKIDGGKSVETREQVIAPFSTALNQSQLSFEGEEAKPELPEGEEKEKPVVAETTAEATSSEPEKKEAEVAEKEPEPLIEDSEPVETSSEPEDPFEAGEKAKEDGRSHTENPYDEGSKEHSMWKDGWDGLI